jgi:hypothetical protein
MRQYAYFSTRKYEPRISGLACTCAPPNGLYIYSIRQHTSAYVSIRQHTLKRQWERRRRQHTSAYVSIRQHTSAYVKEAVGEEEAYRAERPVRRTHVHAATCAYVSIRQHTSACVSIRQHTSAYVSIRQHTSAYVSIRAHGNLRRQRRRLSPRRMSAALSIAPRRTLTSPAIFFK